MSPRRLHVLFVFALGAAAALAWRGHPAARPVAPASAESASTGASPATDPPPTFAEPRLRGPRVHQLRGPRVHHRLAVAALAVVFFAGAAFTAGAGSRVSELLDNPATLADTSTDAATADDAAAATLDPAATVDETTAAQPATEPAPPASAPEAAPALATEPAADPALEPAPAAVPAPEADAAAAAPETVHGTSFYGTRPASRTAVSAVNAAPVVHRAKVAAAPAATSEPAATPPVAAPAPDPEVHAPNSASVVWVNVALPDPIPPSARLSKGFAKRLRVVARAYRVDWALLLGTYRAEGANGSLQQIASRLASVQGRAWDRVLASAGNTGVADRAVALAHYDRAVGLRSLVQGLKARKEALTKRLLADERVVLLPAGRADVEAGRIDVRVLAVLGYLADTFGSVTVSSLESGHRLYARPGVVSAHVYGRAVDVAALDGTLIAGNQEPGGLTEDAVRALLLLPPEVRPLQVISLLGLGGPSFPLVDHADHIHVGF